MFNYDIQRITNDIGLGNLHHHQIFGLENN